MRLTGKRWEGEGGVDIWLLRMTWKEEKERGGTVQEGGDWREREAWRR